MLSRNLTVIAPHPDDEVFGIGGLMRELVHLGHRLTIVAATDGEAAFGASDQRARRELVARRGDERAAALDRLGIAGQVDLVRLELPDGAVADHEDELRRAAATLAGPVLFATWRHDGHPDHEAAGRAAAAAASERSIPLYEYTVWAAHRGRSTSHRAVTRFALDAAARAAKWDAVQSFTSQIEPSPDGRPVVSAALLERLRTDDELLLPSGRAA